MGSETAKVAFFEFGSRWYGFRSGNSIQKASKLLTCPFIIHYRGLKRAALVPGFWRAPDAPFGSSLWEKLE